MKMPTYHVRTKRGVAGAALLTVVVLKSATCGFIFGPVQGTRALNANAHIVDNIMEPSMHYEHLEAEEGWTANWSTMLSIAAAIGFAAKLSMTPVMADVSSVSDPVDMNRLLTPPSKPAPMMVDDPERAALDARLELQKIHEEKRMAEKEARLKEKLAIKQMAEEKKKAEEVISSNVKAELEKITAERVAAQQAAAEKQKEALQRAIAANERAMTLSEEKRVAKMKTTVVSAPAKQALVKALAEKQSADDDISARKKTADEAVSKLEKAELTAAQKRAAVESAVSELARAGRS